MTEKLRRSTLLWKSLPVLSLYPPSELWWIYKSSHLWIFSLLFAFKHDYMRFRKLMDVRAVSCTATLHHAVNMSPHAVHYFTLDYDLLSQLTGCVFYWLRFSVSWSLLQHFLRYVHVRVCVQTWVYVCTACMRLLPKPTLVRVVHYISFICEEDYSILDPVIHSQF